VSGEALFCIVEDKNVERAIMETEFWASNQELGVNCALLIVRDEVRNHKPPQSSDTFCCL